MPSTARLLVVLGVLGMSFLASSPAQGRTHPVRLENARKALKQLRDKEIIGTGKKSRAGEPYDALVGFDLRESLVIAGHWNNWKSLPLWLWRLPLARPQRIRSHGQRPLLLAEAGLLRITLVRSRAVD